MKRLLQWLFGGSVKTTVIDKKPYRKPGSRSQDIIRAGPIPSGVEVRKTSTPHWSELEEGDIPVDHLANASDAKNAAKQAIREKRFDDAWRLLQEQQRHWLLHANRFRFTKQQTLSLLSSIHEDMANILRLERRHDAALSHLIYCLSTAAIPTQAQRKKLGSYVSRCKFSGQHSVTEIEGRLKEFRESPDFVVIQQYVSELRVSEQLNE